MSIADTILAAAGIDSKKVAEYKQQQQASKPSGVASLPPGVKNTINTAITNYSQSGGLTQSQTQKATSIAQATSPVISAPQQSLVSKLISPVVSAPETKFTGLNSGITPKKSFLHRTFLGQTPFVSKENPGKQAIELSTGLVKAGIARQEWVRHRLREGKTEFSMFRDVDEFESYEKLKRDNPAEVYAAEEEYDGQKKMQYLSQTPPALEDSLGKQAIDQAMGLIKSSNSREQWVRDQLGYGETAQAAFHLPYSKLKELYPEEVAKGERMYFEKAASEKEKAQLDYIREITNFKFVPDFVLKNLPIEFLETSEKLYRDENKDKLPPGMAMEQLVLQNNAVMKEIREEQWDSMDAFDKVLRIGEVGGEHYIDPFAKGFFGVWEDSKNAFEMEEKKQTPQTMVQKTLGATGLIAGILVPYGAISKGIKGGVSLLKGANALNRASKTYKVLNALDKLGKSDKLWKSMLAESTIFNLLEETVDAAIRKGVLKQDYTPSDFMFGLLMGAGAGATLQLAGAKAMKMVNGKNPLVTNPQLKKDLEAANAVFEETGKYESIKDMPLGDFTFNEVYKETRFAYLKGQKDANIREGIEKASPPPTPKQALDTFAEGSTKTPDIPKNKPVTSDTDPKNPGGASEAILGSSKPSLLGIEDAVTFIQRKKPPVTERLDNAVKQAYINMKDEYYALEKVFGIDSDVMRRLRVEGGAIGRVEEAIMHTGTFNYKTLKNNGESLRNIVGGFSDVKRVDLSYYMVATRDLSLRKSKTNYKSNIDAKSAEDYIKRMDELYGGELKKVTERVKEFNVKTLDYVQQSGFISKKQLRDIKKANPDYTTPFFREMDDSKQFLSGVKGNSGLKRLKGTTDVDLKIKDPLGNIIKNTYGLMEAVNRNEIKQLMIKAVDANPALGKFFKKTTSLKGKTVIKDGKVDVEFYSTKPQGAMEVVIDGKKVYYETDPDILKAVSGFDKSQARVFNSFMEGAMNIVGAPARTLRAGATLTPEFLLKNMFRDQLSASIFSKHGYVPVVDFARGLYALLGKKPAQKELQRLRRISGAEHSALTSVDDIGIHKTVKEMVSGKGKAYYIKHPIELVRAVNEFGEQGTRMREFQKSMEKAMKANVPIREALNKAAFEYKDLTLNFSRMGTTGRQLNRISAFFNASLEDMDKMIREHRTHPVRTTAKALALITTPTVMLYFVNRENEDYKNLPQWRKDLFWNIPTGNERFPFVAVPRPFGLGIVYGTIPERMLQRIEGEDPDAFKGLGETLYSGFLPNVTPTAIAPFIENKYNKSMFTGGSIVPRRREDVEPELQYGRYTSETAKFLGDMFNYSPAKIENVFRGYTAGLGKYALQGIDRGLGLFMDVPPKPKLGIEQYPLLNGILLAKPIGSKAGSVGEFYDLAGEAASALDSYKIYRDKFPDKAEAYLKEHAKEIAIAKSMQSDIMTLSGLNREKDAVLEHMTMTPEAKKKEMDRIDTEISDFTLSSLNRISGQEFTQTQAAYMAYNETEYAEKAEVFSGATKKEKASILDGMSETKQTTLMQWSYAVKNPDASREDFATFLKASGKEDRITEDGKAYSQDYKSYLSKAYQAQGVEVNRKINNTNKSLSDFAQATKVIYGDTGMNEAQLDTLLEGMISSGSITKEESEYVSTYVINLQ